mgnify:CR=1 FL=1
MGWLGNTIKSTVDFHMFLLFHIGAATDVGAVFICSFFIGLIATIFLGDEHMFVFHG